MNLSKIVVFAVVLMAMAPIPTMVLTSLFEFIKEKIKERKIKTNKTIE
jgi:hypothetical protein